MSAIFDTLRKFFSPKEEVHKHWYSLLDNFSHLSSDFYDGIETELIARNVPGLEISRLELSEGSILSDKREYLRLKRERLVFDICAAPFGTSYFFSFRFVELPLGIKPLELIIFLVAFLLILGASVKVFGAGWGIFALLLILAAGIYVARNALALGLKDIDAKLISTPVLGPLYEVFLRKETYYREDTRLMYLIAVNGTIEKMVEEVTASKGVKLVKRYDRRPIHGELYQERIISSEKADSAGLKAA